MSVYSGFVKRNQEEFYDNLTFKLLELLGEKVALSYHKGKLSS